MMASETPSTVWCLFLGLYHSKLTANSLGSFLLPESAEEDTARSSVLTHEQQGQPVEKSANVSQEPHQDCKLKNEIFIRASTTICDRRESYFIDFF